MTQISTRDRYRGAMVGTLAGDALGAKYEWKKAEVIAADMLARGGLAAYEYVEPWKQKRIMPAGHPTDDSELAAALAESLVVYPAFDPADAYARLRSFIHERRSVLTGGRAYGSGSTLRAALKPGTHAESAVQFAAGAMPVIPSNGSLMRCVAVPLLSRCPFTVAALAAAQSRLTHVHPDAQLSCVAYSATMHRVLAGSAAAAAWEEVSRAMWDRLEITREFANFLRSDRLMPAEEEIWPNCGSVIVTLRAALWGAISAEDFRDGLTKVIALGGDTDTYGAVAGGLLGARYGLEGIPQEWRDVLIGCDKMIGLADALYDISHA